MKRSKMFSNKDSHSWNRSVCWGLALFFPFISPCHTNQLTILYKTTLKSTPIFLAAGQSHCYHLEQKNISPTICRLWLIKFSCFQTDESLRTGNKRPFVLKNVDHNNRQSLIYWKHIKSCVVILVVILTKLHLAK